MIFVIESLVLPKLYCSDLYEGWLLGFVGLDDAVSSCCLEGGTRLGVTFSRISCVNVSEKFGAKIFSFLSLSSLAGIILIEDIGKFHLTLEFCF